MARTADEEMRLAYGGLSEKNCVDCLYHEKNRCLLTNQKKKCSDYGIACKRFEPSGRYKFVVR